MLSWRAGLARVPRRAKAFYATITVGMALGVALNFSAIDPTRALYWSAVLNGVVAVPVMVMMMRLTMRLLVSAARHVWASGAADQRIFILRRHRLTVVVSTETDHAMDFAALNGVTPPPSPH
jgi:hypothetical protein